MVCMLQVLIMATFYRIQYCMHVGLSRAIKIKDKKRSGFLIS